MLAIPPFGASSDIALWRANDKPPLEVVVITRFLNIGKQSQISKEISFAHIDNFIESVMVHPLAPKWYVEIVKEFCNRNNLEFEGQSDLYLR